MASTQTQSTVNPDPHSRGGDRLEASGPKVIQEHLGHSSFSITMDRYGHLYPSERSRVATALDEVYHRGLDSA